MSLVFSGCAKFNAKYNKGFKHNSPLIKDDMRTQGRAEIAKTVEMGPKPVSSDAKKLQKRKKISSEVSKNYLAISKNCFVVIVFWKSDQKKRTLFLPAPF